MPATQRTGQSPGPAREARAGVVRRLYDWTLHWAETPHAQWALFALAFAASSFFPIPPDVLLIAMALARPRRAFRYAAICAVGSVVGGCLGYAIGRFGMIAVGIPLLDLYGYTEQFHELRLAFAAHGFFWIFVAALTPIPYKVFTIAAGAAYPDVTIWVLIAASILGRSLRFFAVAAMLRLFGRSVKRLIERYFNLATLVFVVLLVLGFLCVRLLRSEDEGGQPPPNVTDERPAHALPANDDAAP